MTTPATDIFETETALSLVMDMPGVAKDEVTLRLENDVLEVEGGPFQRRFQVPREFDKNAIEARLADGVLTVELPKAAEAQPRRIPVH